MTITVLDKGKRDHSNNKELQNVYHFDPDNGFK